METIYRPELVFTSREYVEEFARLTGLPCEELTAFKPERLALHELIIRITADIVVPEGEDEETFGRNFRQIAAKIHDHYITAHMDLIERSYFDLRLRANAIIRKCLTEALDRPAVSPKSHLFPFNLFAKQKRASARQMSLQEFAYDVVAGFKAAGLSAVDLLERAVYKSLYRVLGKIAANCGSIGSDQELLTNLISQHVCNHYGSQIVGQAIAPLIEAAIVQEGYTRISHREFPILISLKGASAAGKSSLRPMLKQVMREQGIEPDDYVTISPDVWRRMLLDYESLGPASKYAGHLTSRELIAIDGKLDRYIRYKANRDKAIPHFLVDRFRFDSFSSEQVATVLHNTYAKYVSTIYMYFIVTPPEETVERGWQRALERGRYKAVEEFLGHSVEAYKGMPKILFKWLAYRRPEYRYFFLDNNVPRGTFPKTIAFGNQNEITIFNPVAFADIECYQKINIHAELRTEVYPPGEIMAIARNLGFLNECIKRITVVNFVDEASGTSYVRVQNGIFDVLDMVTLYRVLGDKRVAAVFGEIAPQILIDRTVTCVRPI